MRPSHLHYWKIKYPLPKFDLKTVDKTKVGAKLAGMFHAPAFSIYCILINLAVFVQVFPEKCDHVLRLG